MRIIFTLLTVSACFASATTLEVLRVFQPLSLHGTDVDHEFKGEAVQAHIFARPMVLSGAMPENLVLAVATPHRMPATFNYEVNECNLLTLFQVELSGIMGDSGELEVSFDLSKMQVPEGLDLSIRTVLSLSIQALKKTLEDYHHPENKPLKVKITIEGTTKKNRSLRDLSGSFVVTG